MNASQRQRRQFFEISLQSSGCSQTARDRIDANQKINKQAISRFFVISGGRGSPIPQERYLFAYGVPTRHLPGSGESSRIEAAVPPTRRPKRLGASIQLNQILPLFD
jgi:hypothetical protein